MALTLLVFFALGWFFPAWPVAPIAALVLWVYGFFFGPRLPWLHQYQDRPAAFFGVLAGGAAWFIAQATLAQLAGNAMYRAVWGVWL